MAVRRPRLLLGLLLVGLLVAARLTVFDATRVASGSMAPTLCPDDVVVVDHLGARRAGVGDIVTFPRPGGGDQLIKRVIAGAGQRVALVDGVLEVDGVPAAEPYVDLASVDGVYFGPVTVPAGAVFVLGDDREVSVDSRSFGPVARDRLDGRLLLTLWSACPAPPTDLSPPDPVRSEPR